MLMTHFSGSIRQEHSSGRTSAFIPTVYETEEPRPARWEYRVLAIDPREEELPDSERFNELGKDGWFLSGLLDERATSKGEKVHYYFVRQLSE